MGWPPELNYCKHNQPQGFCERCYYEREAAADREYKRKERERKRLFKKRSEAAKKGWETRRRRKASDLGL